MSHAKTVIRRVAISVVMNLIFPRSLTNCTPCGFIPCCCRIANIISDLPACFYPNCTIPLASERIFCRTCFAISTVARTTIIICLSCCPSFSLRLIPRRLLSSTAKAIQINESACIVQLLKIIFGKSVMIDMHYRIVATIGIHIISQQPCSCRNISIRIDESTRCGIIISALQVIQLGFGVVIISSVAEGIPRSDNAPLQGRCSRNLADRTVTPSVVGVGTDQDTRFCINRKNVALPVLFKIVGIKYTCCIAVGSILEANGRTAFVVQVLHLYRHLFHRKSFKKPKTLVKKLREAAVTPIMGYTPDEPPSYHSLSTVQPSRVLQRSAATDLAPARSCSR